MTGSNVQLASIFRRGGHKQELLGNEALPEQQELSQQLQQLAVAWALPKAKKGIGAAVWRPLLGAFEVIKRGSNQFNGQGFMLNKKLYLNIEEAVFMLDQSAVVLLLEADNGQQQQQLLSMQEALHMMVDLGISQNRLQVLSHLCRLGFHVKRHPACWLVHGEQHPATTWQQNTAWRHTDGLPALLQETQQISPPPLPPAAAAAAAAAAAEDKQYGHVAPAAAAAAAAVGDLKVSRKKRRVDGPVVPAAAAAAMDVDNQQHEKVPDSSRWWEAVPCWLSQDNIAAAAAAAAAPLQHTESNIRQPAAAAAAADGPQQQQHAYAAVPVLMGSQLQQQFPNLRPLRTYQSFAPNQRQQQQQQQREQVQQQQQEQQQQSCQEAANGSCCEAPAMHDLVYDVLPVDNNFSHYNPPSAHFSIAMPKPGHDNIPSLDELLTLAAAAAAAAAAPEGQQQQQQRMGSHSSTKGVMFAMPDGSDVNFYELRPVQLMNLLTNGQ